MEKSKRKIIYYTWEEFKNDVEILAEMIKENYKVKTIYGIEKGGLIPAVMLSDRLSIPLVKRKQVNSNTLVIDDIIETGYTIAKLAKEIKDKKPIVITLWATEGFQKIPDLYRNTKEENQWIVFPWENKLQAEQNFKEFYAKRRKNS